MIRLKWFLWLAAMFTVAGPSPLAFAQQLPGNREYPLGRLRSLEQLPVGRLRAQLEQLPAVARSRALQWLRSVHFTDQDLTSLHVDREGGIYYVCEMGPLADEPPTAPDTPPEVELAALPVSPFPPGLIFHSRPGAANVLFINFAGENVVDTQWNVLLDRSEIPAMPFSSDSDTTTYSDSEQVAIKRIWQRMAEDYAPYNIDVTTERPSVFNSRTAVALITRKTDANGDPNPHNTGGGVAYLNAFGTSSYASYRPAWIYHDNLSHNESYVAEAASHEVGHNLGLSHDGKTDGSDYYGGHGTGEISWGPLMGTGYNRNVSHWCKGDYYLANNSQDDLATIAGKLSYRPDDHGGTAGTATALFVTGGTNIVATTPENDPVNVNSMNKGVLERNTDLDVFSFVTGSGSVRLAVDPWIMAAGTRGGNADLAIELYDEAGNLLRAENPAAGTAALIADTLIAGRYYLHVRGSAAGDPFNSTPTGYTAYGSLGQYFISGYVSESTGIVLPPQAQLQVADLTLPGQAAVLFTVTYFDDVAVDVSTIDADDILVTGPNGYSRPARFLSVDAASLGTPRIAVYAADPPVGEVWSPADNGAYEVWMRNEAVGDTEGAWVAAGVLGEINVTVPSILYFAGLDTDPAWTLEPDWQYGAPSYGGGGPASGTTGERIIGYNLTGNYANNLSAKYATTPAINTHGSSSLVLRFQRWLRTRQNDTASIEVSTDGASWINVWSTSAAVSDDSWQEVYYSLPPGATGSSSIRLRWGLASNLSQNEIGWNIADVEVFGDGESDTVPPVPSLSVEDLVHGGSASHLCRVTYTDDTAVRLSSLDASNLLVTGPGGYSSLAEFVGADLPADGSPMTATYSIPAPGGTWDAGENGNYTITLRESAVEDTLNNATPQAELGSFKVSIIPTAPGTLEITPMVGLSACGYLRATFNPSWIIYTVINAGGTSLDWSASTAAPWLDLSVSAGTLDPGASATLRVSLNAVTGDLAVGTYSDSVVVVATAANSLVYQLPMTLEVAAPPEFIGYSLSQPDRFQMELEAIPGTEVAIEASLDLRGWTVVSTNQVGADGIVSVIDPAPHPRSRWYRARALP